VEQEETIVSLLEEIRDTQRMHLAEYQRASARALELQEQTAARYAQAQRLYRWLVIAAVAVLIAIVALQLLPFLGAGR